MIEKGGALKTLCHTSRFIFQQNIPITFPDHGYLCCVHDLDINLDIYIACDFILSRLPGLYPDWQGCWFWLCNPCYISGIFVSKG